MDPYYIFRGLLLPIDSCCSLSLVSKAHADVIALKHPHLNFYQVTELTIGQNHLRITKAHTDHSGLKVHFADPPMNFTVTCRDTNLLDAFPPLRNQNCSSASPGLSTSPPQGPSSANITCLLTAMPSPAHPSSHIRLHCGFNSVTLCLVMTASLVGSTPVVREQGNFPWHSSY